MATGSMAAAADLSLPVSGNLVGSVSDPAGIPQMGATVQLFTQYQRLLATTQTTLDGRFAFASVPVGSYSVRVSDASFLPVSRDKIAVKAGTNSVLQIHLATLFSNIEVTYAVPTSPMSDDWKWVLRSSPATRPITRFLPVEVSDSQQSRVRPQIFSGTRAMLSLSGGDGGLVDGSSSATDLGTGFALSTNVYGKNQVQVGGAFGQGMNPGASALGLYAIYRRRDEGLFGRPPEVTLTMSQFGAMGSHVPGSQSSNGASSPAGSGTTLRTMSLSFYETTDPMDNVHIEYGVVGESLDGLQHTARISPFARITTDLGSAGQVRVAYSDGGRPDALTAHQQYQAAAGEISNGAGDLANVVSPLARLPQVSQKDGRLELQRTQNFEVGYSKKTGSRTYAFSVFYEDVSNGRLNVAGDLSGIPSEDLFSDGISSTATYNIGQYRRDGYLASINQRVNDFLDTGIAYGRLGGFSASPSDASAGGLGSPDMFLTRRNRNLAAVDVKARIPRAGTRVTANYGWMDNRSIIPSHVFTTQYTSAAPGLNVLVRQPLPSFWGMPGHIELTADLRNMLAQGYIPMGAGDGRRMLLVQTPRAIRGGLNFVF
jgi:hypothetical protein